MKKRSNREAYEKRRGKIDSSAMAQAEEKDINSNSSQKENETLEEKPKVAFNENRIEKATTPKGEAKTQKSSPVREGKAAEDVKVSNKVKPHNPSGPRREKPKAKRGPAKAIVVAIVVVALAVLLFAALYSAFGAKEPFNAYFTFNSATAAVNSQTVTMDNTIFVEDGTAMAPLDGLEEVLPISVKLKDDSKEATVKGNGVKLKLTQGQATVEVNGEDEEWPAAPVLEDGTLYVPLVAFCQAFGYDTAYAGSISRVFVFTPDNKNKEPVATLSTEKDIYEVGEEVVYVAEAEDPDGDEIVDWQWQNHQDYFEEPGEVTITLKVMDARGAVSPEVSKTIEIVEASSEGE